MLALLPAPLRGVLTGLTVSLSTVFFFSLMVPLALLKLLRPPTRLRVACDHGLNALATAWVAVNNGWIRAVRPGARWDVQGVDDLHRRGWYLVSSNHQGWVDILVLQRVFHGKVPFLKFFLKAELIWVPVIGLAWWALDFPFMKRGRSGNPADDLRTTREACEKFKRIPTSVINFMEGTRFTAAKHAEQRSPYRHLLKPKIGGLSVALATMGESFEAMLDVTIAYPGGVPTFWDLLCGRVDEVIVRVRQRAIDPALCIPDPMADKGYRRRLLRWVDEQWKDKDALLGQLLGEPSAPASHAAAAPEAGTEAGSGPRRP